MKVLMGRQWQGVVAVGLGLWGCGGDATPQNTSGSGGAMTSVTTDGSGSGGAGGMASSGGKTTSTGGSGGASTSSSSSSSSSVGSGGGGGDAVDPAARLFAEDGVAAFDIRLSQKAIDDLNADPKKYVKGDVDVHLDGQTITLPKVGVRLKGNYGSLRSLDQKAAFLLKFDKYTSDQKLFGLTKLALNNMVQDPSMMRERIGYRLFRAGDSPAPRAAYATVTVNGALYGLYTSVESTSNAEFLSRWFGNDTGNLYEGAYGSDLEFGRVHTFDQDNGTDVNLADLNELTSALDGMVDPETFVPEVSEFIDLDRYLTFAATEIFLGHWDGYAWTRNNYYIYRRPDDGRWTWIAWGIDQTLEKHLDPWGGEGRIQWMCDASTACRAKLAEAFKGVVARASQLKLAEAAAATKDLLWSYAMQDPRKEVGLPVVAAAIDKNIAFLNGRPLEVQERLACEVNGSIDLDGDGYSGCDIDCDDHNPKVHPGAAEACNYADDDCDGVWDNTPACPQCVSKPAPGGGTLAFCFSEKDWASAEADCVSQGGHLASIHTADTGEAIAAEASSIRATDWWIGLNDITTEGAFTWTDKTPLDFTGWASGEPNNANGGENCVHLNGFNLSSWNDNDCALSFHYICKLP